MPYYYRDPKRDHNFDNHPYITWVGLEEGLGFRSFEVYGLEVYGLSCRAQGHRLDTD